MFAKQERGAARDADEHELEPKKTPAHSSRSEKRYGQPLQGEIRSELERTSGESLAGLRVHSGADAAHSADDHGARAFAFGDDIYFGEGEYDPSSTGGRHLIAHEVAHTIQQRGGSKQVARKKSSYAANIAMAFAPYSAEAEADAFADAFVSGEPAPAMSGQGISIARAPKSKRLTVSSPKGNGGKAAFGASGDVAADLEVIEKILIPQAQAAKATLAAAALRVRGKQLAQSIRRVERRLRAMPKGQAGVSEHLVRAKRLADAAFFAVSPQRLNGVPVAGIAGPVAGPQKLADAPSMIFSATQSSADAVTAAAKARILLTVAKSAGARSQSDPNLLRRQAVAVLDPLRGKSETLLLVKHILKLSGHAGVIDSVVGSEGRTGGALFAEAADVSAAIPQTVAGVTALVARAKQHYVGQEVDACETLLSAAEKGLRRFAKPSRVEEVLREANVGYSANFLRQALIAPGELANLRRKNQLGVGGGGGRASDWDRSAMRLVVHREALEVLAGERPFAHAGDLKAVDRAAVLTAKGAGALGALLAAPAVAAAVTPFVIAKAQTIAAIGPGVLHWTRSNPDRALAMAEFAVGIGLEIGDAGSVGAFLEGLKTPQGAIMMAVELFILHQSLGGGGGGFDSGKKGTPTKPGAYRDNVRAKIEADGPDGLLVRAKSGVLEVLEKIEVFIAAVNNWRSTGQGKGKPSLAEHYGSEMTSRIASKVTHGGDVIEVHYAEAAQMISDMRSDGAAVKLKTRTAFSGDQVYEVKLKNGRKVTLVSRQAIPEYDARGVTKRQVTLAKKKAAQARKLNNARTAAAEAAVAALPTKVDKNGTVHVLHDFDRVIAGGGFSAITDVGTLGNPNALTKGQVSKEVPGTVALAAAAEPWSTRDVQVGQPAAEISTTGSVQPKQLSDIDQGFLEASALSNSLDIARAEAGMVTLSNRRVVDVVERGAPGATEWMVPSANVRVTVDIGGSVQYMYAKKTDIASGPGAARKLADEVFGGGKGASKKDQKRAKARSEKLEADGRVMSGEKAVSSPPEGKILVSGGGATGSWAVEYAASTDIVWVGRGKGPELEDGVSTKVRDTLGRIKTKLKDPNLSANERAYFERFKSRLISHGKSMLPRNLGPSGAFAQKNLRIESGVQIKKVTPTENVRKKDMPKHLQEHAGKPGKVLVEFDGMPPEVFDSVVVSHGPDPRQRGGVADVTKNLKFELDEVNKQLAALQTRSGNVRVIGASMWDKSFLREDAVSGRKNLTRLTKHHKEFGKTLPGFSKGIPVSLNAVSKTVGLANQGGRVE